MRQQVSSQHDSKTCLACRAGIKHSVEPTTWCHDHRRWCNNHEAVNLLEKPGEQFDRVKHSLDTARKTQLELYTTRVVD